MWEDKTTSNLESTTPKLGGLDRIKWEKGESRVSPNIPSVFIDQPCSEQMKKDSFVGAYGEKNQ